MSFVPLKTLGWLFLVNVSGTTFVIFILVYASSTNRSSGATNLLGSNVLGSRLLCCESEEVGLAGACSVVEAVVPSVSPTGSEIPFFF